MRERFQSEREGCKSEELNDKVGRQKVAVTSRWVRKVTCSGEVSMVLGRAEEAFEVVLFQQLKMALGRSSLGALQLEVEKPQPPWIVG